jgi:hypothetical protein
MRPLPPQGTGTLNSPRKQLGTPRVHVRGNLYQPALTLLAGKPGWVDTLFTYHRTWETGVGFGYEGRRIQPFIVLFCVSS